MPENEKFQPEQPKPYQPFPVLPNSRREQATDKMPPPPPKGLVEGRYSLQQLLCASGDNEVWLASEGNRTLALKRVKPYRTFRSSQQYRLAGYRLEREAVLLQRLEGCSHIPALWGYVIEVEGRNYLVMPYYEGESLQEKLEQRGRLPVSQACRIALDLCAALEYVHAKGIIHRDLKPSHVLLAANGKALLSGFGSALLLTGEAENDAEALETPLEATLNHPGSAEYMSPEQARGEGLDGRSDLYSLGLLLHLMLTGSPYRAGQGVQIRATNPAVPLALEQVLAKVLQEKPSRRYPNAAALEGAIRKALQPHRSRAGVAVILVALLALLITLFGLSGIFLTQPAPTPFGEMLTTIPAEKSVITTSSALTSPSPATISATTSPLSPIHTLARTALTLVPTVTPLPTSTPVIPTPTPLPTPLVSNGTFSRDWQQGWNRASGEDLGGKNEITTLQYPAIGGTALQLEHSGRTYMALYQTVKVDNFRLSFGAQLAGYTTTNGLFRDSSGIAGLVLNFYYELPQQADLNRPAGTLAYVTGSKFENGKGFGLYPLTTSARSGTVAVRGFEVKGQSLSIPNLEEEVRRQLPVLEGNRVKTVTISLFTGGSSKCKENECIARLYAGQITLAPLSKS
ncbi:MAG: serine/threonine protein kinase [Chloroflexi bacterium]|uniref:Serine/threonine protein kinase n=1 Tax=Candidatus Chlorohelix allophototropha TaxID=3003348 RepID=A0A8T7M4B4_9CHLR|nr:serine/threonine protein kinase [Chloroflexota bacterium]